MGQTKSQSIDPTRNYDKVLAIYSQLINMGFDEKHSLETATKFPGDLNNAINYISQKDKHLTEHNQQLTTNAEEAKRDVSSNSIETSELGKNSLIKIMQKSPVIFNELIIMKPSNYSCYPVEECISLQRLNYLLKIYKDPKNQDPKLNHMMKKYVINDYHHILDFHLNEERNTRERAANQFKRIYKVVCDIEKCDIGKCDRFNRNNRDREKDKDGDTYMDFLDSIHCYLLHSVDIGYRIIDKMDDIKNDKDNEELCNSLAHDEELRRLKVHLNSTRTRLQSIRGLKRFENNKFMTQTNLGHKVDAIHDDSDSDDDDEQKKHYGFGYRFDYWVMNENYIQKK
eukprot:286022_1